MVTVFFSWNCGITHFQYGTPEYGTIRRPQSADFESVYNLNLMISALRQYEPLGVSTRRCEK